MKVPKGRIFFLKRGFEVGEEEEIEPFFLQKSQL